MNIINTNCVRTSLDMWHHRGLGIDLLLMDAESHEGVSGMATDLLKLEQGMSANLFMAMNKVGKRMASVALIL